MLYVTTRDNRDVFTANHALRKNRGPDGGHYLPFRHPCYSTEELEILLQKPFGHCVADVLNLLFGTKITGWDVEFCIGRYPVRLRSVQHKILLAECWHTPGYRFDRILNSLTGLVSGDSAAPTGWMEIAVRAAILFGVFSDLRRGGITQADVSCLSGDFIMPVSAWYARRWGLPIGNIVCCCNENKTVWDLICHGQMRTDAVSQPTILPEADVTLPEHMERLIYECGGSGEVCRYLECCRTGKSYIPGERILSGLRNGLYVSVVSSRRIENTIPGVYRTHGCLMSTGTALAYAGLLDHRAKTGNTGNAIVWSDSSPAAEAAAISRILAIPEETVGELL